MYYSLCIIHCALVFMHAALFVIRRALWAFQHALLVKFNVPGFMLDAPRGPVAISRFFVLCHAPVEAVTPAIRTSTGSSTGSSTWSSGRTESPTTPPPGAFASGVSYIPPASRGITAHLMNSFCSCAPPRPLSAHVVGAPSRTSNPTANGYIAG